MRPEAARPGQSNLASNLLPPASLQVLPNASASPLMGRISMGLARVLLQQDIGRRKVSGQRKTNLLIACPLPGCKWDAELTPNGVVKTAGETILRRQLWKHCQEAHGVDD